MRTILIIIFIAVVISGGYGFYISSENLSLSELLIGASIAGLFFIWMPLFVYHRWKNKNMKDYMLNKENIEKMRNYTKDKKF